MYFDLARPDMHDMEGQPAVALSKYGAGSHNVRCLWKKPQKSLASILLLQVAFKQTTEFSVATGQNKYSSTGLKPDG